MVSNTIEKVTISTEGFVTGKPTSRQRTSRYHLVNHLLTQFGFGMEREVVWHATFGAPFSIFRLEPIFWQIECAVEQRVTFTAGVREKDTGLTIVTFASFAAPLTFDTD